MTRDVTIHLVHHGQSEANLDKSVNRAVADHAVYVSPYKRTRETWQTIRACFGERFGEDAVRDLRVKESIFLRELEFGLFDGVPDEDLAREFPREHAYYRKLVDFEGEFYARVWLGHEVEWFSTQRNPWNCSVRTLRGETDLGDTFAGFRHAAASRQDERETGQVG